MRKALSTVGLLAGLACNTTPAEPAPSTSERATAALQALVARDTDAVSRCQRAVDACNARVPDAAGNGVCTRLADRCAALEERLAELRGPAEGCWRAAATCDDAAPETARCPSDLALCGGMSEDAATDRDQALECEARVQACLLRAQDLPAAALVACENMAAACDRVAANRADAGDGDAGAASGDDSAGDDSGNDSSGDDDGADAGAADAPSGDDDDDDDAVDGEPRPVRPPPGRGRDRAPNAGGSSAD